MRTNRVNEAGVYKSPNSENHEERTEGCANSGNSPTPTFKAGASKHQ